MWQKYLGYRSTISTHALREEGDVDLLDKTRELRTISTHALREEGDHPINSRTFRYHLISTHALREEGDLRRRPNGGPRG